MAKPLAPTLARAPGPAPEVVQCHRHPDYLVAWDKLQSIRGRLTDSDRRIEDELLRQSARKASTRHHDAAHALVYDLPAPDVGEASEDLKALEEGRRVLIAAIDIAERRVRDVQRSVSAGIIDAIWPAYRDLVARQLEAAAALVAACEAERAFADALRDGGTSFGRLQRVLWPRATPEALERHRLEAARVLDL